MGASTPSMPERYSPARLGGLIGLVTLVLDQLSKLVLLHWVDIEQAQPIMINEFFDLVLVWNRGISYGLFQQESALGRGILLSISIISTFALLIWMLYTDDKWLGIGLGLLAGGAIGNAIDRAAYGAVVDFIHLHWQSWSWYVFNLADAAIVAGVGILMYDSLVGQRPKTPPDPTERA
jgi:signal peptidase II